MKMASEARLLVRIVAAMAPGELSRPSQIRKRITTRTASHKPNKVMGALVRNRCDPRRSERGPQIQSEGQQRQPPGHKAPNDNIRELRLRTGVRQGGAERNPNHHPKRNNRKAVQERQSSHAP